LEGARPEKEEFKKEEFETEEFETEEFETEEFETEEFKSLKGRNFLEKLIKAGPIKIITSFLTILEPDTAAHFYQDRLRSY
jgi:hypothetical protein